MVLQTALQIGASYLTRRKVKKPPILGPTRPTSTTSTYKSTPTVENFGNQEQYPIFGMYPQPTQRPVKPIKVPQQPQQTGTIQPPVPPTPPTTPTTTPISQYEPQFQPTNYNPNLNEADNYMNIKMGSLGRTGQMKQEDIFSSYQSTLGDLSFQKAIEQGKYTNANDVYDNIEKVRNQFTQGVSDPLLITRNTGLPQETVNRILKGEGYKDLQFNPSYAQQYGKPFEQKIADVTLERNRDVEDFNLKADQIQNTTNLTIQDIIDKTKQDLGGMKKRGALTGQILSSGYMQGLQGIQSDSDKLIGRIKENVATDMKEITKMKGRMLEDYQTNMTRIKDKYDDSMNDLRLQGMSRYQEINEKFGLNDIKTKKALLELYESLENSKASIISDTIKLKKDLIDMKTKEQTKLEKVGDMYTFGNRILSQAQVDAMAQEQDISSGLIGDRNITLQTPAFSALQSANQAFNVAGLGNISFGSNKTASMRDQTQTIAGMAKRYGIEFNASNPNETAGKLRDAGHRVADVGKSLHEKGMAVDILPPKGVNTDKYIKKVRPYMEAQGRKWMNLPGDAGHFEFQGGGKVQGQEPSDIEIKYFNSTNPTSKGKLTESRYNQISEYMKSQGYSTTKIAMTEATSLRKEFEGLQEIKNYKAVNNNYRNLLSNIDANTAAGDVASIFSYMKMLDPNSVVREGEFATAQNTAGIPDRISNAYNNAMKGTRLNATQRKEYKESAGGIQKSNVEIYNSTLEQYISYITQGADPRLIGKIIVQEPSQGGTQQSTTTTQTPQQPTNPRDALFNSLR